VVAVPRSSSGMCMLQLSSAISSWSLYASFRSSISSHPLLQYSHIHALIFPATLKPRLINPFIVSFFVVRSYSSFRHFVHVPGQSPLQVRLAHSQIAFCPLLSPRSFSSQVPISCLLDLLLFLLAQWYYVPPMLIVYSPLFTKPPVYLPPNPLEYQIFWQNLYNTITLLPSI
jgi:hypothetical protein